MANNTQQLHRSINYRCSQFPKIFRLQLRLCRFEPIFILKLYYTVKCNLQNQGLQYGKVRRYGTPQFLLRSSVRWYDTPFLFCYGYGTLVRYASKIELKYGRPVWYASRCEVRSTQILNLPYRTAILVQITKSPP